MSDVFLSYAREDLERAKVVARALEKLGWSVWWDARIGIGEVFDEVIEKEIEAAAAVVVLWSRSSVGSRWVRNEASEAEAREKLVPALLEDVMPPLAFRGRQAASLIDWDGEPAHQGFEAVRDAVQGLVGQVRVAPIKEEGSKPDFPAGAWRPIWIGLVIVVVVGSAVGYAVSRARGGGDQASPTPHPTSVATQTPSAEVTPPILARSPRPKPSLASPSTPVPKSLPSATWCTANRVVCFHRRRTGLACASSTAGRSRWAVPRTRKGVAATRRRTR